MLDPRLLRGDLENTAAKLARRGFALDVEAIERLESERKSLQVDTQNLQAERNKSSKSIGQAKAQGEDIAPLLDAVAELGDKLARHEADLQAVLADFKLLPLAVGDASGQEGAEVLEVLWGGPETLIVISSDLSHFLPYQTAQKMDKETVQNILNLHGPIHHQQACGGTPVNGLLLAAKQHNLHPQLLDLRNSGDTAGDKNRVVGYASIAFTEGANYAR